MIIREAKSKDLPSILAVLKASLGETSSKKNEAVWNYKHIQNPFGKSLVLVAEDNEEKIIGVRAFMRWRWQLKGKTYSAYRAVDTATHPEHQGKGIFKKLTLKALDIANNSEDHFVFNTPNSQSRPGYLKMGWEEIGKIKIGIAPVWPWSVNSCNQENSYKNLEELVPLLENYNSNQSGLNLIYTAKTINFLKWRYIDNPLIDYDVFYSKNYFVAGYLKDRGLLKEYRIVEMIYLTKKEMDLASNFAHNMAKNRGAHFITFQPSIFKNYLGFRGNFGPIFTLKNINLNDEEEITFRKLDLWNYSLGDLELF
jgi:predicted N-acetyltransferase YhbS